MVDGEPVADGRAGLFAIAAVAIAFLSASRDVVVDAYRTDLLPRPSAGWAPRGIVFAAWR